MKNIETNKINKHGQVVIPATIRKLLHLNPGDNLGFEIQENGEVLIKPILFVDRKQAWFYSEEIQTSIKEAEEEIQQGQGKQFKNAKEAIAWLKK